MAALIGLVVGALVGRFGWGEWGAIVGGLVGFVAGALLSGQRQRDAFRKPEAARTTTDAAIARLEARLAAVETRLGRVEATVLPGTAPGAQTQMQMPAAPAEMSMSDAATASAPITPVESIAVEDRAAADIPLGTADLAAAPPVIASQSRPNPLWAWFIGGNAMTRIGVVVLFFGVVFLLRYFAEHFTIPIELRLLGVAAAGAVLTAVGWRVARTRPAYGWSLQGAGMGVLYLTTYAAYRQFEVIGPGTSLVLLAMISAATVWLALVADAEALAALAVSGAFLAPILTGSDRNPVPLFSYFAVVNAVVLVIAMARTWRAVSVIGFVFTFVLAFFWGDRYYQPRHYAAVEPFLAVFFAAYVAIAMLHVRRAPAAGVRALDGVLIFGVPLVAFSLQVALVKDTQYGAAWSAFALALVYAGLAWWMRIPGRSVPVLSRSFVALAAVFASIAIPFAFEHRVTAALWSIEAALVYWLGLEQRSFWTRAFALALQLAAGLLFAVSGVAAADDRLFINAFFIGVLMLAVAGLSSAFLADRRAERLTAGERTLTALVFAWGALWWLVGGALELVRQLPRTQEAHAVLAWIVATCALALAMRRVLAWDRLLGITVALPIVMLLVALRDIWRVHTSLTQAGWLVWPLAWVAALLVLRALDTVQRNGDATPVTVQGSREAWHAAAAFALTAQCAWELSEWVGRITADDTVWVACAAAGPAIAYLALIALTRGPTWPVEAHAVAYRRTAAAPIAMLLAAWIVVVNLLSPGEPYPLPYVPLANPLEITLVLALIVLFRWSALEARLTERARYALLGAGVFLCINGGILRAGHHLGGIAWDLSALLGSRSLQAALTLAWTVTGVALMYAAARRALRALWMVGAALLALVVVKLFVIDLAALSGLPRVVAFLGVGMLLLLIGYVSPLPPATRTASPDA